MVKCSFIYFWCHLNIKNLSRWRTLPKGSIKKNQKSSLKKMKIAKRAQIVATHSLIELTFNICTKLFENWCKSDTVSTPRWIEFYHPGSIGLQNNVLKIRMIHNCYANIFWRIQRFIWSSKTKLIIAREYQAQNTWSMKIF